MYKLSEQIYIRGLLGSNQPVCQPYCKYAKIQYVMNKFIKKPTNIKAVATNQMKLQPLKSLILYRERNNCISRPWTNLYMAVYVPSIVFWQNYTMSCCSDPLCTTKLKILEDNLKI